MDRPRILTGAVKQPCTLAGLLASYSDRGLTADLEWRARTFLIEYREIDRHAGVLDPAERKSSTGSLPNPGWTSPA